MSRHHIRTQKSPPTQKCGEPTSGQTREKKQEKWGEISAIELGKEKI